MKHILCFFAVIIIVVAIVFCTQNEEEEAIRIHVTANSNSTFDQNVKHAVKDDVTSFLAEILEEMVTADEAEEIIRSNLEKVEEVALLSVRNCGASYGVSVSIEDEDVPARAYGETVLEGGVYTCLKIDLGNANGDNLWCGVFPSVCKLSKN